MTLFTKNITIDANTDLVSVADVPINELFKVSRSGKWLKLVNLGTTTIEDVDVSSFTYRAINTVVFIEGGSGIYKSAYGNSGGTGTSVMVVRSNVPVGTSYFVTVDSFTVFYEAVTGDTAEDVAEGLKAELLAAGIPNLTGVAVIDIPFSSNWYLAISTTGDHTSSVVFYPAGYYKTKSGLYTTIEGSLYILELVENLGYEYPPIPSIDTSYDLSDLILAPSGIESYLYEYSYPTEVNYTPTEDIGTTDITGAPGDTGVLSENEVTFDTTIDQLRFAQVFFAGNPELIQLLYK